MMRLEGVILFMAHRLLCHTTESYLPEFGNNFHVQLGILYTFLLIVIIKAYYFIYVMHLHITNVTVKILWFPFQLKSNGHRAWRMKAH